MKYEYKTQLNTYSKTNNQYLVLKCGGDHPDFWVPLTYCGDPRTLIQNPELYIHNINKSSYNTKKEAEESYGEI